MTHRADKDRVREYARNNPLEVLRRFAPGYADRMKRDGQGWRGPCPLHGGDNLNFSLTADGRWYCHSKCGTGGDMPDLARRLSGHSDTPEGWREVFRELANVAGVYLEDAPRTARTRPARPPTRPKWHGGGESAALATKTPEASALDALRAEGMHTADAVEVHTAILRDGLTLGSRGAEYLETRGFAPADAAAYGFRSIESKAEWHALEGFLAENFTPEEREAAGVGTVASTGGARVVIPYRTPDGTGFCGWQMRALGAHEPRYLKPKGYSLPWPFNAPALTGGVGAVVHIVEGELNAYTLHTYGLHALGLAGAGTPWRDEWTPALRQVSRVVAWYDADAAGVKGQTKLASMLNRAVGFEWLNTHAVLGPTLERGPKGEVLDLNDYHRTGQLAALLTNHGWLT